jgi:hypothetical protein
MESRGVIRAQSHTFSEGEATMGKVAREVVEKAGIYLEVLIKSTRSQVEGDSRSGTK